MSFMDSYNEAIESFQDGVRRTLYGDDPTDEQIIEWVKKRYGDTFATSVGAALTGPATSSFAQAVRRSLIREMTRT